MFLYISAETKPGCQTYDIIEFWIWIWGVSGDGTEKQEEEDKILSSSLTFYF